MLRTVFRTDPFFGQLDRQVGWMLQELARPTVRTQAVPRVHVHEDEAGIKLVAEVPGLGAEEIEIAATRDTLTVKGQRKVEVPQNRKAIRRERPDVSLDATYQLANEIDPEKVSAKVDNGLLIITAPAAAKVEPKKITVQVR